MILYKILNFSSFEVQFSAIFFDLHWAIQWTHLIRFHQFKMRLDWFETDLMVLRNRQSAFEVYGACWPLLPQEKVSSWEWSKTEILRFYDFFVVSHLTQLVIRETLEGSAGWPKKSNVKQYICIKYWGFHFFFSKFSPKWSTQLGEISMFLVVPQLCSSGSKKRGGSPLEGTNNKNEKG